MPIDYMSLFNKCSIDVRNYKDAAQIIANTPGLTQAQIAAAKRNLEANFGVPAQSTDGQPPDVESCVIRSIINEQKKRKSARKTKLNDTGS